MDDIMKVMTYPLVLMTPQGKIRGGSGALCDLLNYRIEELKGKHMNTILKVDSEMDRSWLEPLSDGVFMHTMAGICFPKNAREIPIILSVFLIRGEEDHSQSVACVIGESHGQSKAGETIKELTRELAREKIKRKRLEEQIKNNVSNSINMVDMHTK